MKVQVDIEHEKFTVHEAFVGANADEIVAAIKNRVSRELPFAMRLIVGSLSPLAFAREVVSRYNESRKTNLPLPNTCDQFVQIAQQNGFASVLEA